jgi:hypothetical protein
MALSPGIKVSPGVEAKCQKKPYLCDFKKIEKMLFREKQTISISVKREKDKEKEKMRDNLVNEFIEMIFYQ